MEARPPVEWKPGELVECEVPVTLTSRQGERCRYSRNAVNRSPDRAPPPPCRRHAERSATHPSHRRRLPPIGIVLSVRWPHLAAARGRPRLGSPPPAARRLCLRPSLRARVDCAPTNRRHFKYRTRENINSVFNPYLFVSRISDPAGRARRTSTAREGPGSLGPAVCGLRSTVYGGSQSSIAPGRVLF